jgi:hypothetical protein
VIGSGERSAAWVGVCSAALIALWWLGTVQLHVNSLQSSGVESAAALRALFLLRLICGAVLLPRIMLQSGLRDSLRSLLALVAVPWPLVVTMAATTQSMLWKALAAEVILTTLLVMVVLLAGSVAAPLQRMRVPFEIAAASGIACAALLWSGRGVLFDWIWR